MGGAERDIPKVPLRSNAEILQHKPDPDLIIRIGEPERAGREAADQVAREHPLWRVGNGEALGECGVDGVEDQVAKIFISLNCGRDE